jgi:predicted transcriptional regulator
MIELVRDLDDNDEWDDVKEQYFLVRRLQRAEKEIAAGKTVPHQEVKNRFARWLK